MSTSKSYPDQNFLISYIKKQGKRSSYRGFLEANRNVIATIIFSDSWRDLDDSWTARLLEEAESLLNKTDFDSLKKKVKSERKGNALEPYWRQIIAEREKSSVKRKRTVTKDDEKENLEPSSRKHPKSIITLICLVRGNAPTNAFAVDIDSSKLISHLKDAIKAKKQNDFAGIDADKLKLWQVGIPDNHDDQLRNLSLRAQDKLLATRKISKYFTATPAEEHVHIIVLPPESDTNSLRNGINSLLHEHNVDKLCLYIEPKLKELIKRGNLFDDRELVTKVLFHALLLNISNHSVDTEVPIKVYHRKVKQSNTLYADLLIVEVKSADNAKRSRFIFEFKNKGVNFLDLQIKGNNSNWEVMERRADKVETMSRNDVLQLKCGNSEKFDNGKTMRKIFDEAREQLLNYVRNFKKRRPSK